MTEQGNLPLGFGMALAQNEAAMRYFAGLPDQERQNILNQTRQVKSRREMQSLVMGLAAQAGNQVL